MNPWDVVGVVGAVCVGVLIVLTTAVVAVALVKGIAAAGRKPEAKNRTEKVL